MGCTNPDMNRVAVLMPVTKPTVKDLRTFLAGVVTIVVIKETASVLNLVDTDVRAMLVTNGIFLTTRTNFAIPNPVEKPTAIALPTFLASDMEVTKPTLRALKASRT